MMNIRNSRKVMVSLFVVLTSMAQAQIVDSVKCETLDINNINAKITPSNRQFLPDLLPSYGGIEKVAYAYPAGQDKQTTIFQYALWIGGVDISGQLCLAAERFNQGEYDPVTKSWSKVFDFQPGPINTLSGGDDETIQQWNRVWKLSASEIQEFITRVKNGEGLNNDNVPEAIRTWPAHGDISKGQLANIAPFFDNDGDGIYNWRKGDYPLIKGDQCIFFVYNDARPHTESGGGQMNIEIHTMAYAFGDPKDTAFWNTMFFNYTIHNRSANDYKNVFTGIWADFDIGYALDDYIGCDVEQGMFYGYNGSFPDGAGLSSHYGEKIPAQGIAILGGAYLEADGYDNPSYNKTTKDNIFGPSFDANYANRCEIVTQDGTKGIFTWDSTGNGDMVTHQVMIRAEAINGMNFGDGIIDNERLGLNRFVYNNNDKGPIGDPQIAVDYYNLMRGIWKDSTRMRYGNNGHISSGLASAPEADFMFPGTSDPCNWGTKGQSVPLWTEESSMNPPGDRRGLGSSGPFNLKANTSTQLDVALISGMMKDGSVDPRSAVETIKKYAAQIKTEFSVMPEKFQNQEYGHTGIYSFEKQNSELFKVYPNPVSNSLQVELINLETANYTIYNVSGQIIQRGTINKTTNIDVQDFPQGMYYLRIPGKTVKFVKE